jgi:hypothetical protein
MKRRGILLILFLYVNICAQEADQYPQTKWISWGLLAGPAITSAPQTGYSILLEGRVRFLPGLNVKVSAGYSDLTQNENIPVKTYWLPKLNNVTYYQTNSYDIQIRDYLVFPLSFGVEYVVSKGIISPYVTVEAGTNIFTSKVNYSNYVLGELHEYTKREDVPAEYRQGWRIRLKSESFRFAFGVGTKIEMNENLNFEVRYIYNINFNILNSHQILMGFSI